MDLITAKFPVFISQHALIKDRIVSQIFTNTCFINKTPYKLYYENCILCVIYDEIGYLCTWKEQYTIVIYKYADKCKSTFYENGNVVNSIKLESTDEEASYFNMLMDYYELLNMIEYSTLYSKKLLPFIF